jgi:hypothetical protein
MKFANFLEYLDWARQKFPRGERSEAAWGAAFLAGWRCECARMGREPVLPAGVGEHDGKAVEWVARAAKGAWYARQVDGSAMKIEDLEAGYLAVNGRARDGRPFELPQADG